MVSIFQEKSKEGAEESVWENINDHYERFSAFMDQIFELNSGFFSIITLYVQTFSVFKIKTSLLPVIVHSSMDIVKEISEFNHAIKTYKEKVSAFGGDKDKLKKFLDSFSRNLSWFLGMTAYKLIKVKDDKADGEKKEDEKDQ